jgi:small-conductance mechanosensitive channel
MNEFLTEVYWGNTGKSWLWALGTLIVCFIAARIFKRVLLQYLKKWAAKTETQLDDFLLDVVAKWVLPLLYIGSVYLAVNTLTLTTKVEHVIRVAILFVTTYYMLRIISALVQQMIYAFIKRQENSETKEKQAKGLMIIINVVVWAIGILFLFDNLGYNITTLITGLGIGGIAIALAAQAVLGDLFSYFVIFFDRPFEIGDFIVVESNAGVIEYIGVKTTRIRTLSGEQLICSNTYLTNSRVHNYKRMEERRIVFKIGVIYQTTAEQLKKIPGIVKDIINSTEGLRFDRGNFCNFGDFSLDFEFVYYVLDPDYNVYMNKQESIYIDMVEAFEKESIEFAYPTQTLFIEGSGNDTQPKVKEPAKA